LFFFSVVKIFVEKIMAPCFCFQVLYYYIEVICRKEEIYMDPALSFVRIIMLFYLTMDHKPLYACLRVLFSQSTGLIPVRATALLNVIRSLHSTPRSLKQMCRISIYKALRRKPGVYANKLPLPPTLREYILNFEPWAKTRSCSVRLSENAPCRSKTARKPTSYERTARIYPSLNLI